MELNNFVNPRYRYRGPDKPENFLFNATLQEFAQNVSYVAALQTGGKITSSESYEQIKMGFKQLKKAHKQLKIEKS
ncbi:hypothetical protein [Lyngbya sp. CCY1209]|uniref:DUF7219 family protein n=1 Tax=Lyngbya sp. CCY1209 TaxID=2886103 RepID=UPI002D200762|nr:hypothetical protein [Lyngbya sp. CCY1209]MEB3882028.1 hypothetical protein [Lyngbya sp. CCY1209]